MEWMILSVLLLRINGLLWRKWKLWPPTTKEPLWICCGKIDTLPEQQNHQCKVSISYGKSCMGFEGTSHSYHQAYKTLLVGLEKEPENSLFVWQLDHLAGNISWRNQSLLPWCICWWYRVYLEAYGGRHAWKTFIAYCESSMNISRAARNLYVHRNTLIYRLNKISELFHMDTQSFEQCIVLYVALKKGKKEVINQV